MTEPRDINEILDEALTELREREHKVAVVVERASGELKDIRAAIKRLAGSSGRAPARKRQTESAKPVAKGELSEAQKQIVEVLAASLEPMQPGEIAEKVGSRAAGVGITLRFLERGGHVIQTEGGWGVASKVAVTDE